MNRVLPKLGFTALALVAGSALYAQSSSTTGSVSGVVADSSNALLSGATVTLSSSQITRTLTTGSDGSFRLGLLNPGAWTIKVAKDGFQTQTVAVNVAINDNRAVAFKLGAVTTTTVEIVGTVQVVDTTSTMVGQNLNMEQIASIPNGDRGRDFTGVAFFAPGVSSGGFQANAPSMSGASAAENSYYVDGLDTTNYQFGTQGAALKSDFIDQVSIQTGGYAPEYSALGGVINAITKSGSNDFKGSAWASWDAVGIHAKLKNNQFFQETPANDSARYDIGAEVGGPIIKDKLFYFVGVDAQVSTSIAATNQNSVQAAGFTGVGAQDLTSDKIKDKPLQTVVKLNWYINQDMQLAWYANYNYETVTQGTQYSFPGGDGNVGIDTTNKNLSTNLNYDWTVSPSVVFSAKAGYVKLDQANNPAQPTQPNVIDYTVGAGYVNGGPGLYSPDVIVVSKQLQASVGVFVATHSMKFGVSHLESDYTQHDATSGGLQYLYYGPTGPIEPVTGLTIGAQTVDYRGGATVKAYYNAFFAQDNWEITPGFRLLYGFRFETQEQDDYKGVSFVKFNSFKDNTQPRLGFTWDVNKDGKTKVEGSLSRYFERIPQRAAYRTWAPETFVYYDYQPGQVTWTSGQGVSNPSAVPGIAGTYFAKTDYSTPFSYDPVAQGIKLPRRDEVTLGIDHTFDSGWTLGVHGTYRMLTDPIEDSVILTPGNTPYSADGHAVWWNPGPSVTWTQTFVSPDAGTTYTVNNTMFAKSYNKYRGITLNADKRSDRDYFSFNYTLSRLEGNYEGVVTSSNGQEDGNITASDDTYAYAGTGRLPLDHTSVAKLQYSHRFTVANNDLNVGTNVTYQSGSPLSRFGNGSESGGAGDPYSYGNSTPYQNKFGNFGTAPALSTVDIHGDYAIAFGPKVRLSPSLDIFNAFNKRTATGINQTATLQNTGAPDPKFGYGTSTDPNTVPYVENAWLEGRRFRFGVKVKF
jgi:hypothetical protein